MGAVFAQPLMPLGHGIWNYGKKVMKFQVVSESASRPIGFGMSPVRQIVHVVDGLICYLGYLFSLWDAKRQTFADKIMSTGRGAYPGRPG